MILMSKTKRAVCSSSFNPSVLPLYYRSTVWWWYFATQVLKAESLSLTDVKWAAWGAHEPAVVHAALQPLVLIVSLPLLSLGLLHLPAQLQHQGLSNHFRRLTSWAPIVRLVPAEPRHARCCHRPSAAHLEFVLLEMDHASWMQKTKSNLNKCWVCNGWWILGFVFCRFNAFSY